MYSHYPFCFETNGMPVGSGTKLILYMQSNHLNRARNKNSFFLRDGRKMFHLHLTFIFYLNIIYLIHIFFDNSQFWENIYLKINEMFHLLIAVLVRLHIWIGIVSLSLSKYVKEHFLTLQRLIEIFLISEIILLAVDRL